MEPFHHSQESDDDEQSFLDPASPRLALCKADTRRLLKINEYFKSDKTVKVTVGSGEDRQSWFLNEELLCAHSSYFRAAFQGQFQERESKQVNLEELIPTGFALLVDWIHSSAGDISCSKRHGTRGAFVSTHDLSWYALYVVADFLDINKLAEKAISQIMSCLEFDHGIPKPGRIKYLYDKSMEESSLREAVVDRVVASFFIISDQDYFYRSMEWTRVVGSQPEFHEEVMDELKNHTSQFDCEIANCSAHSHQNGVKSRRLERNRGRYLREY
ncbi:hypothetical protein DL98DRAFT_588009 [Cadophora sp. DSE1049]|nr:hypothetical protein DL98DRAFT_588009 [Cadophora sp. DSE1049]